VLRRYPVKAAKRQTDFVLAALFGSDNMKRPKPEIPKCAPEGTVWFGGPIAWFSITLRILGDHLDPDEVSAILGCQPESVERKGKPVLRPDGTVARIGKTGAWRLELSPADTDEWDCGEAIMVLMSRLPAGVEIWRSLTQRFRVDVSVALSMESRNKGFLLSPQVMRCLGERGIEVGFDIYYEDERRAD
jgi:hypothetical protein